MAEINTDELIKMGTKSVSGIILTFYTNEEKDSLYLEAESDINSPPLNIASVKRLTQSLKGNHIEEGLKLFVTTLHKEQKTSPIRIMVATPAKHGQGRMFIQDIDSDHVKTGEIIGRISAPEPGEGGVNLFGQAIPARTSYDLSFTYDESIYIKEDKIISYRDGKLIYNENAKFLTVSAPYGVEISEDKMEAKFTYLDKPPLTPDLIRKILEEYNIIFGVNEKLIDELAKQHQQTGAPIKDVLIAKGTNVKPTKHGRIVFSFESDTERTFEENQSGKVDYKANTSIQCVNKGEKIAIIKPPKEGKPGRNILGMVVNPEKPREALLKPNKNVSCNDDKKEFIAEMDGSPVCKHGTISVVEIMQIAGDLDLSTGNIDFEGSVRIDGDVGDDYTIKAEGDIFIGGSVGTSKLYAGGNIIIQNGFNGRGSGYGECIGDFSVKFMKEVKVHCEGNIFVEKEALNCNLNALGQLIMPDGNLMGGDTTVLSGIFLQDIGSALGIKTRIYPGINYLLSERKTSFEKQIEEIKVKTNDINNIIGPILKDKKKLALLPSEKKAKVSSLVSDLKKYKQEHDYLQQELNRFLEDSKSNRVNEITVYRKVYPGSYVKIGYSQKEFKTEISGPVLITEDLQNSTIKTGPIKLKNKPAAAKPQEAATS